MSAVPSGYVEKPNGANDPWGADTAAGKVGLGTWLGLLLGAVLKVVIAFLMISTFAAAYMIA